VLSRPKNANFTPTAKSTTYRWISAVSGSSQ
jgi:hypothetical protein